MGTVAIASPGKAWRNRDRDAPEGAFDLNRQMCQNFKVTNTSIILRMLLIVGLIVSPLYPRVFNPDAMAMSGTRLCPDEMSPCADAHNPASPCHDGKMDCDKTCMAACVSLSVQCLPSIASTVARVVVIEQRFAIRSEAQLASLAAPPPARPPRA
jgi:hypothetical protein